MALQQLEFSITDDIQIPCWICTLQTNGEEERWYKAKDIASYLGYQKSRNAIHKFVSKEWIRTWSNLQLSLNVGVITIPSSWQSENIFISEPGLYELVINSDNERAKHIKRWFCQNVFTKHATHDAKHQIQQHLSEEDKKLLSERIQKLEELITGSRRKVHLLQQQLKRKINDEIKASDRYKVKTQNIRRRAVKQHKCIEHLRQKLQIATNAIEMNERNHLEMITNINTDTRDALFRQGALKDEDIRILRETVKSMIPKLAVVVPGKQYIFELYKKSVLVEDCTQYEYVAIRCLERNIKSAKKQNNLIGYECVFSKGGLTNAASIFNSAKTILKEMKIPFRTWHSNKLRLIDYRTFENAIEEMLKINDPVESVTVISEIN